LPSNVLNALPTFNAEIDKSQATRKYSQTMLNAISPLMPELMGGSADLTPSNLTALACSGDFQRNSPTGRYLRFGVREHAMAAICNGLFAYGGIRPFCASFLTFAGYAMGSIRLSALSQFGILYIMTHDSIGLGEDGPTHQPVELLENLRSMPNINVIRPADCNEMNAAYRIGLTKTFTPTVICCSRGSVPVIRSTSVEKALNGAYVLVGKNTGRTDLILIGTGSEVGLCVAAAEVLQIEGIETRVVSMPCQDIFLEKSEKYQLSILPGNIPTLSVEASVFNGWHRFSHAQIGMTRFGMSGPGATVFENFGFTVKNVVNKAKYLCKYYQDKGVVPNIMDRPFYDIDDK